MNPIQKFGSMLYLYKKSMEQNIRKRSIHKPGSWTFFYSNEVSLYMSSEAVKLELIYIDESVVGIGMDISSLTIRNFELKGSKAHSPTDLSIQINEDYKVTNKNDKYLMLWRVDFSKNTLETFIYGKKPYIKEKDIDIFNIIEMTSRIKSDSEKDVNIKNYIVAMLDGIALY